MKIQQIRNATIKIEYAGKVMLIDPMLGEKGCMPPFPFSHHQELRNPIHDLLPLYDDIYKRKRRDYWQTLALQVEAYTKEHQMPYVINDLPYGRSEYGHPVVVNYFYHEEIRQTR